MVRSKAAALERVLEVQVEAMTARGFLIALAISLVLWLFLWWMVSIAQRGFDSAAVETVATDVSLPKFPAPTTTTLPPPTTTTTRPAPVARTSPTVRTASVGRPVVYGTGACGGDLPPCWVMRRESGGNINAYNPTGCGGRGCRGKWQCDPRTCSGTGTEEQQDAEARALWAGGRGCSHWAACG